MLKRINKYAVGKTYSQGNYPGQPNSLSLEQLQATYAAIIGSPAQVAAGIATHSDPQAALDQVPPGSQVLWLSGTYTLNLSVSSVAVKVIAQGYGVNLAGSLTFAAAAQNCDFASLRVGGNITLQSGSGGNFLKAWMDPGFTFLDQGANNDPVVIAG